MFKIPNTIAFFKINHNDNNLITNQFSLELLFQIQIHFNINIHNIIILNIGHFYISLQNLFFFFICHKLLFKNIQRYYAKL